MRLRLSLIEFGKKDMSKFELKRRANVIEELVSSLESQARQTYVEKMNYYIFTGITNREDWRKIFPTMIRLYLIIVITSASSWVGHIMSKTSVEKQQITLHWKLII